ncbi:MAG: ABC transporter ATP-binding protein/permease [Firmicutes bacterium]|nr:ABC transporter ATP-binding protein/permease [Bacillota bacterium]
MLSLLKHLKPKEWLLALASVVFVTTQVFLDLRLPRLMREIVLNLQLGGNTGEIWKLGGFMLLSTLGSAVCAFTVGFLSARVSADFSMRLRGLVYDKAGSFSHEEMNKFTTASLITRSTNDITQVGLLVAISLQVLLRAPIMAVWATTEMVGSGWQWTLAVATTLIIMLIVLVVMLIFVLPKFKVIQKQTDNLNAVTRENLTGLRVVRAYNAEELSAKKFKTANEDLTKTHLFTTRSLASVQPLLSILLNGLTLSVYFIGAHLINSAPLSARAGLIADMTVFSSYAMQVIMAFIMITMVFIFLPRASVSALRINEVLSVNPLISYPEISAQPLSEAGEVEFKNVSFGYPNAEELVLKNVSFKIESGETVAFIGSTGSGKSTLINLVARFYDITAGELLISGVNIKDFSEKDLNKKLGYVAQKAVLFSGTVKENIALGSEESEGILESVIHSAGVAKASEFISKMDNSYDSLISQEGKNLSGGQKQRISIARAICKKPDIFIFDDSFSALDYKTDKELRASLKENASNATVLIVAQRISTIMDADKIIVLENGEVAGIGKHNELLKDCAVYKEIALSQGISKGNHSKGGKD